MTFLRQLCRSGLNEQNCRGIGGVGKTTSYNYKASKWHGKAASSLRQASFDYAQGIAAEQFPPAFKLKN